MAKFKPYKRVVMVTVPVEVAINDPDVVGRITGPGGDEWREHLYKLDTEDEVLEHLAYNLIANGVSQVRRLDGWADMPNDAATMSFGDDDFDFEVVPR